MKQEVDYKSLNRQTSLTIQQKSAIKKIFVAAEQAVIKKDASLVNEKTIHLAMGGWFTGDEKHDMQALFREISCIVADNNYTNNISGVISSFRMNGRQRRIIRQMANSIVAQAAQRE